LKSNATNDPNYDLKIVYSSKYLSWKKTGSTATFRWKCENDGWLALKVVRSSNLL